MTRACVCYVRIMEPVTLVYFGYLEIGVTTSYETCQVHLDADVVFARMVAKKAMGGWLRVKVVSRVRNSIKMFQY